MSIINNHTKFFTFLLVVSIFFLSFIPNTVTTSSYNDDFQNDNLVSFRKRNIPFLKGTDISVRVSIAPISIANNNDFLTCPYVSQGNGSSSNPFIIENFFINNYNDTGVFIANTTTFVVIRNVWVNGTKGTHDGFYFRNATNLLLENNIASFGESRGFLLFNSNNSKLINNQANFNSNGGIIIFSSKNNTLMNNILANNTGGISLQSSSNSTLFNNTAYNNDIDGFSLIDSYDNYLYKDISFNNSNAGFTLISSRSNTIINCSSLTNKLFGFYLFKAESNILFNNSALNTPLFIGKYGFYIYSSSKYNTFTGNIVCYFTTGFGFYDTSKYNQLTHNTALNNDYGFYLEYMSNYNYFENNTATQNLINGFFTDGFSNYTIFIRNIAENNGYDGFYFALTWNNILMYNSANKNKHNGFTFNSSASSTSKFDTSSLNSYNGVLIFNSSKINLNQLSAFNNSNFGIEIFNSSNGKIAYSSSQYNEKGNFLESLDSLTYELVDNNFVGPSTASIPLSLQTINNSDSILIAWEVPESNGGYEITSYNVYRGMQSDGPYNLIGSSTQLSFIDKNVQDGIIYYYKVTAINIIGESDKSSYITASLLSSSLPTNDSLANTPTTTLTTSPQSSQNQGSSQSSTVPFSNSVMLLISFGFLYLIKKKKLNNF